MADEIWCLRNVPTKTRKKIKKYAQQNQLTIAGVIIELANKIDEERHED